MQMCGINDGERRRVSQPLPIFGIVIKGLYSAIKVLWIVFWNMDKMPTNEQLKEWGQEPVLYQQPYPGLFNQKAHRHHHRR